MEESNYSPPGACGYCATVVDEAIRFVASHVTTVEKANFDKMAAGKDDRDHDKQQPIATTNTVF